MFDIADVDQFMESINVTTFKGITTISKKLKIDHIHNIQKPLQLKRLLYIY
jgi:hypothetical protein